jgi:hypothetical protein
MDKSPCYCAECLEREDKANTIEHILTEQEIKFMVNNKHSKFTKVHEELWEKSTSICTMKALGIDLPEEAKIQCNCGKSFMTVDRDEFVTCPFKCGYEICVQVGFFVHVLRCCMLRCIV